MESDAAAAGSVQLELWDGPPGLTPEKFAAYLNDGRSRPVHVTVTSNRVSLLSIRPAADGSVRLRSSRMLLEAPPDVLRALKRYLASPGRADWQRVCSFLRRPLARGAAGPPPAVSTKGRVFDLAEVFARVNREFFQGHAGCRIGWGRAGAATGRRGGTVCYGTYSRHHDLIRISPVLDDAAIPPRFVDYIVYHEILHAVVEPELRGERLLHHSPRFRTLERAFPDWKRMHALSSQLARRLLRERAGARLQAYGRGSASPASAKAASRSTHVGHAPQAGRRPR